MESENHETSVDNPMERDPGESSSELSAQEKMLQENAELKDRVLRQMADMDNLRKRFEREKSDLAKFATESLLSDMMPVLDSFEQASGTSESSQSDKEKDSFRDGLLMVKKQLLGVLRKHGLEQLESVDQPFDPNFHQAIQRIESADVTADTVGMEYAKGYTLNGRLLRAAMVSVKVPAQS